MDSEPAPQDDNSPVIPKRVRWLLVILALLIIVSSGFALRAIQEAPEDIDDEGRPQASFTHVCEASICTFTGTSTDEQALIDWVWDFGDGDSYTGGSTAVHAYPSQGVFRVTLTVVDGTGTSDTISRGVSVGAHVPRPRSIEVAPPVYAFGPHIGASGGWELVGPTFTAAHLSPEPETTIKELNAAQADGKPIILLLAQSAGNYKNPDGTFSLEMWKERIDRFADFDFTPWIEDGTFLVHYLISEPMSRSRWGGEVITAEVLDEMARYSKEYWPDLPTTVREQPTDLMIHTGGYETPVPGWTWTYLDAAWARYSARKGPIDDFIEAEVSSAKEQGLALLFGMNVLSGGDGRSNRIGYNGGYVMSPDELMEYGSKMIEEPYGCAMIMWHLNFDDIPFFGTPEVDAVMERLGELARNRDPIPCA